MKCPHCRRGKLIPFPDPLPNWTHTCDVCGRGWYQDKDGNWHSVFAADVEVYSSNGKKLLDCSTWHINKEE